MRRLRKWLCIAFFPLAFIFLLATQSSFFGIPPFLAWPLLLSYIIAYVVAMNVLDVCPWCKKSFHTNWKYRAGTQGFAGLLRATCANCGEPTSAGASADTPE
jgi:hypothetical protein